MMFVRSLLLAVLATAVAYKTESDVASNATSSTCFCTTVPCPVVGTNTLVNGTLPLFSSSIIFLK
jgi:hypothetical protein